MIHSVSIKRQVSCCYFQVRCQVHMCRLHSSDSAARQYVDFFVSAVWLHFRLCLKQSEKFHMYVKMLASSVSLSSRLFAAFARYVMWNTFSFSVISSML